MTTVAWDGKIIAADTQSCFNDSRHTASKLFDLSRYIIGFTGDLLKSIPSPSQESI